MKTKFYLSAVVATSAIATSILLASASSAQPCSFRKQSMQAKSWLTTPLAALVTLPGIALAMGLSLKGRAYENIDS